RRGKARHAYNWSHRFAETDDVPGFANRQQFPVAPEIRWPTCEDLFAECLANSGQIIPHQERLSGARQVVYLVRFMPFAGHCAFEMRYKTRKLDLQIVIVRHGQESIFPSSRSCRTRNTIKCDSKKLTAKLTTIDTSFAGSMGMT